ncbi:DNA polymerase III subunit delta [Candidatus Pelagibacter sp.]|uniref:DNA polymerase III subunit delta n=1 Tax=Candidatus Pelagibacter sp. TaxID=2024849 RepID=UPI003F87EE9D
MIIKSYEINKIKLNKTKIILLYGQNQGAKEEIISKIIAGKAQTLKKYDEKDILENTNILYDNILSRSLFESEKIILISRSTDKIYKIIEYLENKELDGILIILEASILEKKSKLRNFFEKNKNYLCIPFYSDDHQTLSKLASDYVKEKKLIISQSNINLIINRSNGDRGFLKSELNKIYLFSLGGKKINTENLSKLTNLIENYGYSELVDNCLAKNNKKTILILNENNFSNEDCVIISRTFLQKLKRIKNLSKSYAKNKDLNKTISDARPPIFWKDKNIVKSQIEKWKINQINQLIYEISEIELQVKKNYDNAVNIVIDFILEKSSV